MIKSTNTLTKSNSRASFQPPLRQIEDDHKFIRDCNIIFKDSN